MENRGTGELSVEIADVKKTTEQLQEVVSGSSPSPLCVDLSARGMWARYVYQGFRRCGRPRGGQARVVSDRDQQDTGLRL